MTRWEDLTNNEKTALRQLARGELREVSALMIRRLVALGLADPSTRMAASLPQGSISIEQGQSLPAVLPETMNDPSITWRRTFPDSAPGTDGVAFSRVASSAACG